MVGKCISPVRICLQTRKDAQSAEMNLQNIEKLQSQKIAPIRFDGLVQEKSLKISSFRHLDLPKCYFLRACIKIRHSTWYEFHNWFHRRVRSKKTAVTTPEIGSRHCRWQGQEDSNPRPTVLESICGNASPPEHSLFRNFSGVWKPCLRTAILIDTFLMLWKSFSAIAGSQNSHNFPIGGVLLQAPIITKYAAPDDL